jgi:hypothetical protein
MFRLSMTSAFLGVGFNILWEDRVARALFWDYFRYSFLGQFSGQFYQILKAVKTIR